MPYQFLLQNISKHINLTKKDEEYFTSLLSLKKIKKKNFVLQEGEVNKHLTFVVSGILRLYSIDKNGFEHILQFAPAGWWIGDMRSFLSQLPASLYIDAIEDSEVILLFKPDLEDLYINVPEFERFFRILAENALATYQHRLIDNLSLPAIERFNNFCKLYPTLTQTLAQKYIASYVGVTPEFFSKMLGQPQIKN